MFQINAKKTSKTRKAALFLILAASLGLFLFIQVRSQALDIINRVSGYILLQVESYGEAWYVIPTEDKRIYLQNGDIAYQVMRNFSLGITNANLTKIPIGLEDRFQCLDSDNDGLCDKLEEAIGTDPYNPDTDGDGYLDGEEIRAGYNPLNPQPARMVFDYTLANRLKGRILLQVESRGQAWYVNPRDGKRYYMPDGQAAYQIMRYLSLGITNTDLNRVPIFNSSSLPSSPLPSSPSAPEDTQAPTAPVNLTATASGNQISLTWTASTDNVGVSQYRIERSMSASTGFSEIAFSNISAYINIGLNSDTTYYYRVRAVDTTGNFSPYSNIASARTTQATVDTQTPTAPGSLMAVGSSGQIALNWTASTDNVGVSQYRIERSMSASTGFSQIATTNTTSYNNTGLSANTTYYYRVRAVDAAGNLSPYSNIASSTTAGISPPPDTQAPTAPGSLAALPTDNQISLTWTASTDNVAIEEYSIERSMSASSGFSEIDTTGSTSYINTGLSINTTYYYRVRAVDAAGNLSPYSNTASAIIYGDTVSSVIGEDYFLPSYIGEDPNTGYICNPCSNSDFWTVSVNWKQLEPQRGVYDWSVLEQGFASAQSRGRKVYLHLSSINFSGSNADGSITVSQAVPDWVFDEFDLDPANLPSLGWTFNIKVIPQWRPEIREAFHDMLRAMDQAGYTQDSRLGAAYIHGISPSRGEEFWMHSADVLNMLEADWGLTPVVMYQWLSSRMDVYKEIFVGQEHKIAWVGSTEGFSYLGRSDFEQVARDLFYYNLSLNFGNRSGSVERYLARLNYPAWASTRTTEGYILVDESSPLFDGRYFGEENEEYGSAWEWRFGAQHSDPQRYRMTMMRALQARMRYLWTNSVAETLNPALSRYARLSFGKDVFTTPDAWALLFESPYVFGSNHDRVIRNFERWLIQREVSPGGVTTPALKYNLTFNAGNTNDWFPQYFYDNSARRTDYASDNNYIYFDLDDRFLVGNQAQIKVELVDNSLTSWHLDYYNSSGALISTPTINNLNDGQTKTYTITINNPNFANQFSGLDFRLVNEGPGDITVRWVRVLRYF